MKFLHLADLHIGKRVCETSMTEAQEAALGSIIEHLRSFPVDAVVIAGDIYDRSIPPESAVILFSDFLENISNMGIPVLLISGNHDSPERLSFASGIMKKHNIHFVTSVKDSLKPVTLCDEYGPVNFYMLPYLRPSDVSNISGTSFSGYTEAVKYMTDSMNIDTSQRNVIISHQFIAGADFNDTETCVGGTEAVSADAYSGFDYAALGHLHKPQNVKNNMRYAGSLLKYSEKEVDHKKSVTVVELGEKGSVNIDTFSVAPIHDMRMVRGSISELTRAENVTDDYIYAVVTDTNSLSGISSMLRQVYPNLVHTSYEVLSKKYDRERVMQGFSQSSKTPLEVFTELYETQHGGESMSGLQLEIMKEIIDSIEKDSIEN